MKYLRRLPTIEQPADDWSIRPDTTYLNHGSFGPSPNPVREVRHEWLQALEEQPMDFYVRQFEPAWRESRDALATWLRCPGEDLAFVENATAGMNVIANSFSLTAGDEVLLTDHEYGAVKRIWEAACGRSDAKLCTVKLPSPIEDQQQLVDTIVASITPRTRLLVVSHLTSATAIVLPIEAIVAAVKEQGVAVCVDGPHAPLQIPLDLAALGCDFYTASCHKWLSAPLGSGFLYVAPQHQSQMRPLAISWGRLLPAEPTRWYEHLMWSGTRDPSPYLAVPAAIEYFATLGEDHVRTSLYNMAEMARGLLEDAFPGQTLAPPGRPWYAAMTHWPLPAGDAMSLQQSLWESRGIEVPIIAWNEQRYVRVSCHLYNTPDHLHMLMQALKELVHRE